MSVSNDEREKYIIEWLNKYELPILKQCSTVEGIIKALNESELRSAFIGIEVKKFIIPCLIIVLKNLITKKLAQPEITFKNEHNTLVVDDHKDVVNTKTTDVIVEPSNMVTALMLASNDGNLKIVNKLLMQGADPNKKDINGWTALMIAAQKCYVNVVNTLLAHGAQPNISTSDSGTTALTAASDKGYVEVVDKLLASGAEVDFATDSGWTALMFAAQNGHVLVVKKLLANGADLNKKGDGGWTALMLASQGGHTQVVEDLLFDKKVKINEANNYGMTPLMLAIERKYVDIGVKLLERGADSNISVVGEENEGWTALMFASSEGFVEIVNMLLDTGANPNKKNKKGADAIDIAEYFGHKECVAILRKYLN
jgi:serine/threonine-protein phosphatase 6 regulatory ankyrin repeat subunit B